MRAGGRLREFVIGLSVVCGASRAHAQQVIVNSAPGVSPRPTPTSATVLVPGTFGVTPAVPALVESGQQGRSCNPGTCYVGTLSVRGNQRWQLQVRLHPSAPATFSVRWVAESAAQDVPLTSAFETIATGTRASSAEPVALRFNARRSPGAAGGIPGAVELAAFLEYRVIPLP